MNADVSGVVKSESKHVLKSATVIIIHEPTQNKFYTQTNGQGYFHFFNVKPGGPYTIKISYSGYEPLTRTNLFLSYSATNFYSYLQENELSEFILERRNDVLDEVQVKTKKRLAFKYGSETNITPEKMNSLPSISRNLQDYVRMVPQALVNSDGGISLAGQNNKFNTFFIDGANNNDLLGLAPSGINGGQSASPPVSIEAIEEIQVSLAPYDVQYSNFTGGTINAITLSGSNTFKSSAWYFFRNEDLAGKSPEPLEVSGSPGVFKRQRLAPFFNQTIGSWISGPLVKDKLFYFLLGEKQKEYLPQTYNFAIYEGNSRQEILQAFADTLRTRYGYEPGSFLETKNDLDALRINAKLDWNPSDKNKLLISYRYNRADRLTSQETNTSTTLRFSNNFYRLLAETHTASLEWKRFFSPKANNRLLLTFTHHMDDRNITGVLFPQIQINDGRAVVVAGGNGSAQLSLFKGTDLTLLNVAKFVIGNNVISTGADFNFARLNDIALIAHFGNYRFSSFAGFFNNASPNGFNRAVSLVDNPANDNTKAGSNYNTRRLGVFISDDIRVNARLKLTAGLRWDRNVLPGSFSTVTFFNQVARPEISRYYDLEGAEQGRLMKTHWQLSPRVGFEYRIPQQRIVIRGGGGMFTGHILNLWASEFYNVNVYRLTITNPAMYNIKFNPDPYHQPTPQALTNNAVGGSGDIAVVSKNFKYPVVFKTSAALEKKLNHGWNVTTEFLVTRNIHEPFYTNVNLLPPTRQSASPDSRNVFSQNTSPEFIPMPGGNPYSSIILMSNNRGKKGYSYSFTTALNKSNEKIDVTAAYTYGHSVTLFEPNFAANTTLGQWQTIKTVNGKNYAVRGTSDFDPAHRIYFALSRKLTFGSNQSSALVTLFYNGQSGTPFSYVYQRSLLNDAGAATNADLIYIPTVAELNTMIFLPRTEGTTTYSAAQQQAMLNDFIEKDKYLQKHRGEFAERNGARLPFTHVVDFRMQQNFKLKTKHNTIVLTLIYDVFNFTNMLNRNWGRSYTISNGAYPLITFAGFANPNTLTPQYQFKPVDGDPWSLQNSTSPGSSPRWISQLGLKINFER